MLLLYLKGRRESTGGEERMVPAYFAFAVIPVCDTGACRFVAAVVGAFRPELGDDL